MNRDGLKEEHINLLLKPFNWQNFKRIMAFQGKQIVTKGLPKIFEMDIAYLDRKTRGAGLADFKK